MYGSFESKSVRNKEKITMNESIVLKLENKKGEKAEIELTDHDRICLSAQVLAKKHDISISEAFPVPEITR